jgi:hypothetical protein
LAFFSLSSAGETGKKNGKGRGKKEREKKN